jgi:hypothetical protein
MRTKLRRMGILFSGIVILILFSSFHYGVREGTLICKSESGRTLFNAKLEDGIRLESAEFIIDSSKILFDYHDYDYVIFDPLNKVYTICLEKKIEDKNCIGKYVKFWTIPSSFKLLSKVGQGSLPHEVYAFRAKIFGSEPRNGFDFISKEVELNCTLDLE